MRQHPPTAQPWRARMGLTGFTCVVPMLREHGEVVADGPTKIKVKNERSNTVFWRQVTTGKNYHQQDPGAHLLCRGVRR